MKKVLVTNDDGINAQGLHALVHELHAQNKYDIRVCAPEKEQSAVSHAVTVRKPLYAEAVELPNLSSVKAFSISGTPADCVRLALLSNIIDGFKPDIVLSGINRGNNCGFNVVYSGTVGGALEGAIFGIPSVALSLNHPATYPSPNDIWRFDVAAQEAIPIIDEILARSSDGSYPFLNSIVINVNFPSVAVKEEIKGVKLTKQGVSRFKEEFFEDTKSQGARRCYKMKGVMRLMDPDDTYDTFAMDAGWITLTPIGARSDLQTPSEVEIFEKCFHSVTRN